MAPNQMIAIFAFAIVMAMAATSQAVQFTVGDDKGWGLNVSYVDWAAGKEFHVGDTLVFNYPVGKHNVFKSNLTEFQNCTVPDNAVPLTTGADNVTLAAPGVKWYFCTVGKHCINGQKLKITVMPQMDMGGPPAPAPTTSLANAVSTGFKLMIVVMVATVMTVVAA